MPWEVCEAFRKQSEPRGFGAFPGNIRKLSGSMSTTSPKRLRSFSETANCKGIRLAVHASERCRGAPEKFPGAFGRFPERFAKLTDFKTDRIQGGMCERVPRTGRVNQQFRFVHAARTACGRSALSSSCSCGLTCGRPVGRLGR